MTKLTDEIMKNYQVRKTKKQKTAFIELMQAHFPDMRVETGGLLKSRNLVLGDVENAKIVFSAHYDTCSVLPVPNILFPKNLLLFTFYQLLVMLPIVFVSLVSFVAVLVLTESFWPSYLAFIMVYVIGVWILLGRRPNEHTVNDNTSGVVTLCEAIERMDIKQRQNAAFVFFDNEETGMWGASLFRKMHKEAMREKLLINFDCVSDGDHFLIVANKKARVRYGEILSSTFPGMEGKQVRMERAATTLCPSDQMKFPCSAGVIALKRKKMIGLYLDKIHTKHDTVFREENITYFVDCICRGCVAIRDRK